MESRVENALGSFNLTIPVEALKRYKGSLTGTIDNWLIYATMLTDIRTICPLQELASHLSENFASKIYSYVATQKRTKLGLIADSTSDIEAIFDMYKIDDKYQSLAKENEAEMIAGAKMAAEQSTFVQNMQDMFYTFVKTGELPQGNRDMSQGMYTVNVDVSTQRSYPNCDYWKSAMKIVPKFANLD